MSTIAISRALHDKSHPFAMISSAVARALPVEELGLLVKLLTFGEGWEISRDRLQRDYAVKPGELKRLLPELVERGHLTYDRPIDPKSRKFNGKAVWRVSEQSTKAEMSHVEEIDHVDSQPVESHVVDFHQVDSDEVENHRVENGDVGSAEGHGTRAESNIPFSNIPKALDPDDNNPRAQGVVVVDPEQAAGDESIDETPTVPARPTVWQLYSDVYGDLSEFMGQKLQELIEKHGEPWLRAALIEAGFANADSFSYVTTILDNWQRQGYATPKHSTIDGEKPAPKARSDLDAVFFDNPAAPKNDLRLRESESAPDDGPKFIPPPDLDDDPKNDFRVVHEVIVEPQVQPIGDRRVIPLLLPAELKAVGD